MVHQSSPRRRFAYKGGVTRSISIGETRIQTEMFKEQMDERNRVHLIGAQLIKDLPLELTYIRRYTAGILSSTALV